MATLAANVPGANRLKFTPDGKQALVTAGSAWSFLTRQPTMK